MGFSDRPQKIMASPFNAYLHPAFMNAHSLYADK